MIIDVNVSLGFWPFQRLAIASPAQLQRHLEGLGIDQAWVSAVESVLYPEPDAFDEALLRRLRRFDRELTDFGEPQGRAAERHPRLRLAKTLNPVLANWRQSLAKAAAWGCPAVKLYPNYHLYSLASPEAVEMAREASELGLVALVQMRVEDERGMYPPLHVPGVAVDDVVALADAVPQTPIIALCPYLAEARELVRRTASVWVDLAFVETPDTLATALMDIPSERLVFGSHTPFLCTRAEAMKLQAANVSPTDLRRVQQDNVLNLTQA
jgi:uncharacterized protein